MTVRPQAKPAALIVAASLAAVEGLVLLGYAVLEAASMSADRVALAVTTTLFFATYGGLLLLCAYALTQGRSWARSPVELAQLIQLGVAWSFRGENTSVVAVVIALVAVVVLIGLFVPSSLAALSEGDDES